MSRTFYMDRQSFAFSSAAAPCQTSIKFVTTTPKNRNGNKYEYDIRSVDEAHNHHFQLALTTTSSRKIKRVFNLHTCNQNILPMFHAIKCAWMPMKNLTKLYLDGKLEVKFDSTCDSDQVTILKMIMGLPPGVFEKPVNTTFLNERLERTLKGRGLAGERLRELIYMYGFDIKTRSMDRQLKNMQMRINGPFPVNPPNPRRTAVKLIPNASADGKTRCFTCGRFEDEEDAMGQRVRFEIGHLDPHNKNKIKMKESLSDCMMQCLHCNRTYKDYVTFDSGKPNFNVYAIMRDCSRLDLASAIKRLKIDV